MALPYMNIIYKCLILLASLHDMTLIKTKKNIKNAIHKYIYLNTHLLSMFF